MTGLYAITNKEAHPNDWNTLRWNDSSSTSGIGDAQGLLEFSITRRS